jgi:hypothetical protein
MEPVTTIEPAEAVDPPPATPTTGRPARLIGAAVGAVLGLATFALVILVGRLTGLAETPALAMVAGEEGILSPTGGAPLAWLVPPLAAAVAGALDGPAASRGVRWVGTWMGFVTYVVGVAIGAVLLVGVLASETTTASSSPLGLLTGIPILLLAGAVVLAPLLLVCIALGIGWAAVLRRVAGGGAGGSDDARPVLLVAIVGAVLAALWLIWSFIISILVATQTG